MESHQLMQYAAQEIPTGIKRSFSLSFNFLQIYHFGLFGSVIQYVMFPFPFSLFSFSLFLPLFPLSLSPSLCFDVWALRALTAELVFPSWLLSDGGLDGRWVIGKLYKLEIKSCCCLCGFVHIPTKIGLFIQIKYIHKHKVFHMDIEKSGILGSTH